MTCECCGHKIAGRLDEPDKVQVRNRINKAKYIAELLERGLGEIEATGEDNRWLDELRKRARGLVTNLEDLVASF